MTVTTWNLIGTDGNEIIQSVPFDTPEAAFQAQANVVNGLVGNGFRITKKDAALGNTVIYLKNGKDRRAVGCWSL